MTRCCMSSSTTCRSAASGRAAWGTITAARARDFLQAQAGVRGGLDFGGADLHAAALYALFPPHRRPHGVDEELTGLQFHLSGFGPGGAAHSYRKWNGCKGDY